jgi:2-polyprenyl-3-methyl-5-hydroxy-6-metoxy-1,4-benzoquinol methylase
VRGLTVEYWDKRKGLRYYREAVEMARTEAPDATSVVDVGSGGCQYITWIDWASFKVSIDPDAPCIASGVTAIKKDFMEIEEGSHYDLALCLQVLEHIEDPKPFAMKLMRTARIVVISVPYKWKRGETPGHVNDPIDEAKLEGWTGSKIKSSKIINDEGCKRLVASFIGA